MNLTSQKKQVLVDGIKSIILDVTSRAMQGSVLEPLLFLIYINLMVEKVYEDEFYLFVEKLKVYNEIWLDIWLDKLITKNDWQNV